MDYKIIEAHADTGQIVVQYTNNGEVIGTFAIDVPIVNSKYITGTDLSAEIMLHSPTWILARKEAVATVTNFSEIESLVT